MSENKLEEGASPEWLNFRDRHAGHPFLTIDPLYALTEEVIAAISTEVCEFFGEGGEVFERDLARTSRSGFIHGVPIEGARAQVYPPGFTGRREPTRLPPSEERIRALISNRPGSMTIGQFLAAVERLPETGTGPGHVAPSLRASWDDESRDGRLVHQIRECLHELLPLRGLDPVELLQVEETEDQESDETWRKQEAFAMWIILESDYQANLSGLKKKWEQRIAEMRSFPVHPSAQNRDQQLYQQRFGSECLSDFGMFHSHWGLERLLTWDLPLPLLPRVITSADESSSYTRDEGVSLFLPWSVLRGDQFDVAALIDRQRSIHSPPHLAGWLNQRTQGEAVGPIALQRQFWLFRVHTLVLFQRYASSCRGNLERIDLALATVFGSDVESVRKLRHSLNRELKNRNPE